MLVIPSLWQSSQALHPSNSGSELHRLPEECTFWNLSSLFLTHYWCQMLLALFSLYLPVLCFLKCLHALSWQVGIFLFCKVGVLGCLGITPTKNHSSAFLCFSLSLVYLHSLSFVVPQTPWNKDLEQHGLTFRLALHWTRDWTRNPNVSS